MLISVGERISNALCAMAVHDLGHEAISLTGSQAGIVTDTVHGKAKIAEVRATRINDALDAGKIVLVAGFQGVSADSHDVTTLGRGGSNLTAVALAAALGAGACEMYTDVEGVFTADPRIVPDALQAPDGQLRGDARDGGERRQSAPATLGRVRTQPRRARSTCASSFSDSRGHVDRRRGGSGAREGDHQRRHPHRLRAPRAASAGSAPRACSSARRREREHRHDRAGVERRDRLHAARRAIAEACEELLAGLGVEWSMRDDLGKVSLVGAGMKSHPGVAAARSRRSRGIGVQLEVISTSSIKSPASSAPRTCRRRCGRPRQVRLGRRGARGA